MVAKHLASHGKKATERGRFLSEDPVGIKGGLNLYLFGSDDPVNGRDPSGLRALSPEEIEDVSPLCDHIDCHSIELYDLGWEESSKNTLQDWQDAELAGARSPYGRGLTLGHTIYINLKRDAPDFRETLIHELTHVWQNEGYGGTSIGGTWGSIFGALDGLGNLARRLYSDPYYVPIPVNPYKWFLDYNNEQQATIVSRCLVQLQYCNVPGFPFPHIATVMSNGG